MGTVTEDAGRLSAAAVLPMPTAISNARLTEPVVAVRLQTVAVVAHPDQCTLCEACLDACSHGAITLGETAQVDAALCTGCGACESACPNGVFEMTEV